ncbi:MAG: 6-phosphofructokinase [Bacteroidota bacterium]
MSAPIKTIAVMTSGGDAPGMNAAIRAVVRTAKYHKLNVMGVMRGYEGLIKGDFVPMNSASVRNIIHRGGTILKSARSDQFRTEEGRKAAYEQVKAYDIDALITIGGNGTFTGANLFSKEFGFPVIGIPGTIDNDLHGTDHTIGYDTAVNTAIEAVDKIRDTADSHDRLFFIEVMGRDAGFIALSTGIGSGAGTVLLPETHTDIEEVIEQLDRGAKRKKLFNLVIVAEGNQNGGAVEMAKRVEAKFQQYETKVAIIGHIQRGGSPTAMDRLLASRLGYAAVEALVEGKHGVMIGVHNNSISHTPIEDAITIDKPLNHRLLELAYVLAL